MGMWDFAAQHELAAVILVIVVCFGANELWHQIYPAWLQYAAEKRRERARAEEAKKLKKCESCLATLEMNAALIKENEQLKKPTYTCCHCKKTLPVDPRGHICPACYDENVLTAQRESKRHLEDELDAIHALANCTPVKAGSGWSAAYKAVQALKLRKNESSAHKCAWQCNSEPDDRCNALTDAPENYCDFHRLAYSQGRYTEGHVPALCAR